MNLNRLYITIEFSNNYNTCRLLFYLIIVLSMLIKKFCEILHKKLINFTYIQNTSKD